MTVRLRSFFQCPPRPTCLFFFIVRADTAASTRPPPPPCQSSSKHFKLLVSPENLILAVRTFAVIKDVNFTSAFHHGRGDARPCKLVSAASYDVNRGTFVYYAGGLRYVDWVRTGAENPIPNTKLISVGSLYDFSEDGLRAALTKAIKDPAAREAALAKRERYAAFPHGLGDALCCEDGHCDISGSVKPEVGDFVWAKHGSGPYYEAEIKVAYADNTFDIEYLDDGEKEDNVTGHRCSLHLLNIRTYLDNV